MPRITLLALLLALGPAATARAESLAFKTGGAIQVPATIRDGTVTIPFEGRDYLFPAADFRKIVPGGLPESEWPARRDRALDGGAEPRFAAAMWALENGLTPEAASMFRAAHASDPRHQPAARACDVLDRLDAPWPDADPGPLARALRLPLQSSSSPHILLLHQSASPANARRLDLLERVTTTFYVAFAVRGVELTIPDRKLVSVYLDRKADYLAFVSSQGASAFRSAQGFYHPGLRAVVAFDARTDRVPSISPSRLPEGADPSAVGREALKRALLRRIEATSRDLGIAAHEMVHQLIEASGLSTRPGSFPTWLHEGLAAQFEVVRGGRWAGVGQANDLRLDDWRRQAAAPGLLAATLRDSDFARGYSPAVYARSWALVHFLWKERPVEWLAYLERLRQPAPSSATFSGSFDGSPTAFEGEWKRFMRRVATPLESLLSD